MAIFSRKPRGRFDHTCAADALELRFRPYGLSWRDFNKYLRREMPGTSAEFPDIFSHYPDLLARLSGLLGQYQPGEKSSKQEIVSGLVKELELEMKT